MYVCGMTVYDLLPPGPCPLDDRLRRGAALAARPAGYAVTYVRNITDIDDKIIRRAVENGETIRALTDRMIDAHARGRRRAGHRAPHARAARHRLRAADAVDDRARWSRRAWPIARANGDVNYAVRKFPGYGKL